MTEIKKFRDWCFTSFDLDNYEKFKNILKDNCKYCVYQVECCPDTNKKHIQGYVEFKDPKSLSCVKNKLKDNSIHLEKRRGTDIEARNYCMKIESKDKNYDVVEIGEFIPNAQGARNDLINIYKMLKENKSDFEIQEKYPGSYCRYYKGIKQMRANIMSKQCGKFRNVNVIVNIGEAGCGKTRNVYEKYGTENVYRLKKSNNDNVWFDDYNGQKVLLIDDFYGWIKYSQMLELLDGYVLQLDCKGSYTYGVWDTVVITSNKNIEDWYRQGLSNALGRRINEINKYELDINDNKEQFNIPVNTIKNGEIVKKENWMLNEWNCMEFKKVEEENSKEEVKNKGGIGNTNYATRPLNKKNMITSNCSDLTLDEKKEIEIDDCCEDWPECECLMEKLIALSDSE